MPRVHYIAMDTHSDTTDISCKTRANTPGRRWHVKTSIPVLREVITSIRRPRVLAFEEGPLASWLYQNLKADVDQLIVCDPRKNALIARCGDKDDAIDSNKLNDLLIGGYLKAVHHSDDSAKEAFKHLVGLYHRRVRSRVSCANQVIALFRRWGVVLREKDFAAGEGRDKRQVDRATRAVRAELLDRLGKEPGMEVIRQGIGWLWADYDQSAKLVKEAYRLLKKLSKKNEVIVRLTALPGVSWIRAATLYAYLDTPWRFKHKQALWKYMGIGLVRKTSGKGPELLRVERAVNRRLKSSIIGAAQSIIKKNDSPFAEQYRRWVKAGLSAKNARRNVARSLGGVAWGMWKSGAAYDPDRVGVAAFVRSESSSAAIKSSSKMSRSLSKKDEQSSKKDQLKRWLNESDR